MVAGMAVIKMARRIEEGERKVHRAHNGRDRRPTPGIKRMADGTAYAHHARSRPGGVMILRAIAATLGLAVTSCGFSSGTEPYRCLHEVSLNQLIEAEGLPQSRDSGRTFSTLAVAIENQLFDTEQEAVLSLDNPSLFVGGLCARLKSQLASRCNVTSFWAGVDYCSAVVESPQNAVTSAGGRYIFRPVRGRVLLLFSQDPQDRSKVILTTTEWTN
jgi:hypothetical protein